MPAILLLLGAAAPLIGSLTGVSGVILAVLNVIFFISRIYLLFSLMCTAFWLLCATFAKDIVSWLFAIWIKLMDFALSTAGMPDGFISIQQLVDNLPPSLLEILSRIGVFSSIHVIVGAYFVNWGLSSIPLVGRLFRS